MGNKENTVMTTQGTARPKAETSATETSTGAPGSAPVSTGPLGTVVTRNEFYRDGFRNLIRIVILQAVVIIGLILALTVYMTTSKPSDRYFATTVDGRILQLISLDQPNMNTSALMSWATKAVSETMTFGYHDYQRRLQESSRYFTRRGWESFASALQRAKIIESIQANSQVVTAEPRSAPTLQNQGVINGKYRWLLRLPVRVTYKSGATQTRVDNMTVALVVERVSSLENPSGVGVESWVATIE